MKLIALVADTFREIYARKVIIGIIIIQVVTLVITGLVLFGDGMQRTYDKARQGITSNDSSGQVEDAEEVLPGSTDTALLGSDTLFLQDSARTSDSAAHGQGSATFHDTAATGSSAPDAGDEPVRLEEAVQGQMGMYGGMSAGIALLLSLFAVAGIVPSMMEKGTVDLLLSKPLSRTTLLLGRALGGVIAIALNLALFVTAVWMLYGLASGVWLPNFLISTFGITLFTFIVVYSGVILLNVLTESWVLPISMTYVYGVALAPTLKAREETLYSFIDSDVLRVMIDGLYYILPQTMDLIDSVPTFIYRGDVDHALPFIQGLIFAGVTLTLAAWKFQRKDF